MGSDTTRSYYLTWVMLENAPSSGSSVTLTDDDIARLPGLLCLCNALKAALGSQFVNPDVDLSAGRVHFYLEEANGGIQAAELVPALLSTAEELVANANLTRPLPINAAVKRIALVRPLKAVSDAAARSGVSVVGVVDGVEVPLPALPAAVFADVDSSPQLTKTGRFHVCGHTHLNDRVTLFLDGRGFELHLPQDDPHWSWPRVYRALGCTSYVHGSVVRESKSGHWVPGADARLISQPDLLSDESSES